MNNKVKSPVLLMKVFALSIVACLAIIMMMTVAFVFSAPIIFYKIAGLTALLFLVVGYLSFVIVLLSINKYEEWLNK